MLREKIEKKIEELEDKKLEGIIEKESLEKDISVIDASLGKLHFRVSQLDSINREIREEVSKLENALEVLNSIGE